MTILAYLGMGCSPMSVRERFGLFWAIYEEVALRCRFGRDLNHFKPFMKELHSDVGFGENPTILSYFGKGCTPKWVRERFGPFLTIYEGVALRCRFM